MKLIHNDSKLGDHERIKDLIDPILLVSEEHVVIHLKASTQEENPFGMAAETEESNNAPLTPRTPRAEKIKKDGLRLLSELQETLTRKSLMSM